MQVCLKGLRKKVPRVARVKLFGAIQVDSAPLMLDIEIHECGGRKETSWMEEIVCIKTFERRVEAEMAKGLLQNSGIEAQVLSDDMGGTNPAILTSTGGSKLFVRAEDSERAAEILAVASNDADAEDDWE